MIAQRTGIGFIDVDVHFQAGRIGYADDDITQDSPAFAKGLDIDDLAIFQMAGSGLCRRHVDVPFGDDDTARQVDRSPGTDEGDPRRPLEMTGQGNRRFDAQTETVGLTDFNLAL